MIFDGRLLTTTKRLTLNPQVREMPIPIGTAVEFAQEGIEMITPQREHKLMTSLRNQTVRTGAAVLAQHLFDRRGGFALVADAHRWTSLP